MRPVKPPSYYYCGRVLAAADAVAAIRKALQDHNITQGQPMQPASPRTQHTSDSDRATLLPNGRRAETRSFYRCRMLLAAINTAAAILPIVNYFKQSEKKSALDVAEMVFDATTHSVRALTFFLPKPPRLLKTAAAALDALRVGIIGGFGKLSLGNIVDVGFHMLNLETARHMGRL